MMPKLPPRAGMVRLAMIDDECNHRGYETVSAWTEDQVLAYGRAVAEACAALCESARNDPVRYPEYNEACDDCAAAIREMASGATPE